jgi:hypothetical protein
LLQASERPLFGDIFSHNPAILVALERPCQDISRIAAMRHGFPRYLVIQTKHVLRQILAGEIMLRQSAIDAFAQFWHFLSAPFPSSTMLHKILPLITILSRLSFSEEYPHHAPSYLCF